MLLLAGSGVFDSSGLFSGPSNFRGSLFSWEDFSLEVVGSTLILSSVETSRCSSFLIFGALIPEILANCCKKLPSFEKMLFC